MIFENLWIVHVRRAKSEEPFEVGPREKSVADAFAARVRKEHPTWRVSVNPAPNQ